MSSKKVCREIRYRQKIDTFALAVALAFRNRQDCDGARELGQIVCREESAGRSTIQSRAKLSPKFGGSSLSKVYKG